MSFNSALDTLCKALDGDERFFGGWDVYYSTSNAIDFLTEQGFDIDTSRRAADMLSEHIRTGAALPNGWTLEKTENG